jgi:hypothetical protein
MPGQLIMDFGMTGDRLLEAISRVEINIMARPMPQQDATGLFQQADDVLAFQSTSSLI